VITKYLSYGLLTATLVVGVVLSSGGAAWATSDRATSVKVGSNAFLAGMYAEAGLKENGSFGSRGPIPSGFHPQGGGNLGFVVIRDKEQPSWSAASGAGLVDGDFFTPGTAYEGWALKVGSVLGYNNHEFSNSNEIAGTLGSVTNATGDSGNNTVGWTSSTPFQGLNIVKTYSLPQAGQRVDVTVTLTNTTGAPITNIYYGRGVDPDDGMSDDIYPSTNTVVSQISEPGSSSSRVSAAFTRGSQILLDSKDPRSRVAREIQLSDPAFDPSEVWEGSARFDSTVGSSATADMSMNLAVKIDSLGAGQSTTFTFSYLLTATADDPIDDSGGSGGSGGSDGAMTELPSTGVENAFLPWWAVAATFGGLILVVHSRRLVKGLVSVTPRSR
jgi:hypothetical protein